MPRTLSLQPAVAWVWSIGDRVVLWPLLSGSFQFSGYGGFPCAFSQCSNVSVYFPLQFLKDLFQPNLISKSGDLGVSMTEPI